MKILCIQCAHTAQWLLMFNQLHSLSDSSRKMKLYIDGEFMNQPYVLSSHVSCIFRQDVHAGAKML